MEATRTSSNAEYQGINETFEKLLQTFNIPMDCYLLTTMIATHFDSTKFKKHFYKENGIISVVGILNFIMILPIIFIILSSGIIVFFVQAFILYLFVASELSTQSSDENTAAEVYLARIVLIVVFAMMVLPDYQNSVKKIAIGLKTPTTMTSFKVVTVLMSLVQMAITLIVIMGSMLVIRTTEDIADLLQNFTVLYIIIQIDETVFTFLCISNIMSSLRILGFKQDVIKHLNLFQWVWRTNKKKKEALLVETVKKTVETSIVISQFFFLIFVLTMGCVLMTIDLTSFSD